MDKLQTSLSQWRTKLSQNSRESTERNAALRQEKDAISGHFQTLKSKLNQERERNSKSLVKLASDARATKETLASHLALASRILSSSALARELETERERILPFYASSVGTEEVVMSQQVRKVVVVYIQIYSDIFRYIHRYIHSNIQSYSNIFTTPMILKGGP